MAKRGRKPSTETAVANPEAEAKAETKGDKRKVFSDESIAKITELVAQGKKPKEIFPEIQAIQPELTDKQIGPKIFAIRNKGAQSTSRPKGKAGRPKGASAAATPSTGSGLGLRSIVREIIREELQQALREAFSRE